MFRIPLLTIVFISAKIVAQCNYCDQRDLRLKLSNFWKKIHGNHCLKYDIRLYSFPVCDSTGYHLVFEDNFEQEKLDTLVWQIQPWRQGALATDAWMEYNSMDNVLLENGLLKIVARKDTVDAKAVYWETEDEHLEDSRPNFRRYFYTSANLWSRSVFFMGKFEARIKMPASKGLWPAFWLYGGERWNEIDIFDNYKPGLMVTSSGFDFDGKKYEPVEELTIDIPESIHGKAIELVSVRKAEMVDMHMKGDRMILKFIIPSRGLMGLKNELMTQTSGEAVMTHRFMEYQPYKGDIPGRINGSLISMETGKAIPYSLHNLQDRGIFFIEPNEDIYEGQVIGEHNRPGDLVVNVTKTKKLTNIRAAGSDEKMKIAPPRKFSLEEALEYIQADEYVEVTPQNIRIRKILLKEHERKRTKN